MKTNVALTGFMGSGKTAVGKILAEKLNKQFVEMDSLIKQKAGKSISQIFAQDGEIAFRQLEIELTKEVGKGKKLVIACGGGIVLNKINIDRLQDEAVIVYLTASPTVILKRISADKQERPVLKGRDNASAIGELLRFRKPFYERAADIRIDTSKLNINSVANEIIAKLKEYESFHQ
jgi:shikimate kinase|tara:strand:- start:256 stop:786 length:531 start_codon:yes stop_codon:yes gene_type:complete